MALAALATREENAQKGYAVLALRSMDRAWSDLSMIEQPDQPPEVEMCRNEAESFQLVLVPTEDDLDSVEVTARYPTGQTAAFRGRVEWWRVDYAEMLPHPTKGNISGLWPDVLSPPRRIRAQKGEVVPLWFTVHTDADCPAGEYTMRVTIAPERKPSTTVTTTVRVWDILLEEPGHFGTTVTYWLAIHPFEDSDHWTGGLSREQVYYDRLDCLLEHRFSPFFRGIPDGKHLIEYTDYCLAAGAVRVGIATSGDPGTNEWYEHYKERNQLDRIHVLVWDEPHGEGVVPKLRAELERVRGMYPGLPIIQTIGEISPSPKEYGDLCDIWVPLDWQLRLAGGRSRYVPEAMNDRILWGYSCSSGFVDSQPSSLRTMFWGYWRMGATGFLYWSAMPTRESRAYEFDMDRKQWIIRSSGNGGLLYIAPGARTIPSSRLEHLRDSIEDYEMLWQLGQLAPNDPLLAWENDAFRKLADEPSSVLAHRREVATRILQLKSGRGKP